MIEKKMTPDEILVRIKKEPFFALGFAVDNNPDGVIESLALSGYKANSRLEAFEMLRTLLNAGQNEKVKAIISRVEYMQFAPNYTGGFKDYFLRNTPPNAMPKTPQNMNGARFDFNGLLAGLGVGLTTYSAIAASEGGFGAAPSAAEVEEQKKKEEEEKKKKTYMIIGIVGGSLLLILILWLLLRPKKGKDNKGSN